MSQLKTLHPEAVTRALEKALRYRLLNEPMEAESICRDVLEVEPDNQEALTTLLLALTLLLAEDVDFLWRLRRLGRSRGQRLGRARGAKATTSLRKFDEHGQWHYFPMALRGAVSLVTGRGLRELADCYWYRTKR